MSYNANRQTFLKPNGPLFKNGIPDIVGVLDGKWIGFEVKAGTKQSDTQKWFEGGVVKSGGHYFVVRSVDDVISALAKLSPPQSPV